jgi:predicted transposase YbfD/YdcC
MKTQIHQLALPAFAGMTTGGNNQPTLHQDVANIFELGEARQFKKMLNKRKVEKSKRLFITSLDEDIDGFMRAVRKHGSIEINLHWSLDVSFREDLNRARAGHSAQNLATVRRIALNLLTQEKTHKRGISCKRKTAGWNNKYLMEVLKMGLHKMSRRTKHSKCVCHGALSCRSANTAEWMSVLARKTEDEKSKVEMLNSNGQTIILMLDQSKISDGFECLMASLR